MFEPLVVPLARMPLPEGAPQSWMVTEVIKQGAQALPLLVMAGTDSQRLVCIETQPERQWIDRVEAALAGLDGVTWTGAWGSAMVKRDGRPVMISFARLRQGDTAFITVWSRLPGSPPRRESAEVLEGSLAGLPRWARGLFARDLLPGVEPQVSFEERELEQAPWPGDRRLPDPDFEVALPPGASFEDALRTAALVLEARFATEGRADPSLVGWHKSGVAGWWRPGASGARELRGLGERVAEDDRTLGVGMFGMGNDHDTDPPSSMIALVMESRAGDAAMWLRRFEELGDGEARWTDDMGVLRRPVPPLGWFGESE